MRKIKLTRKQFALVDDEDFEFLSQWEWYACGKKDAYYAKRAKGVLMHRVIMDAPEGTHIDHINRNGLDNRRSNLRLCTYSINMQNRASYGKKTNKHKGVEDRGLFYSARIYKDNKAHYLGSYKNEIDAIKAYNKAALELFGEQAYQNPAGENYA